MIDSDGFFLTRIHISNSQQVLYPPLGRGGQPRSMPVCVDCLQELSKAAFSATQLKRGKRCKQCVEIAASGHEAAAPPPPSFPRPELPELDPVQQALMRERHKVTDERSQRDAYVQCLRLHDEAIALLQEKQPDAALRKFTRARANSLKLHDANQALEMEHRVTSGMSTSHRLKKEYEASIRLGREAVALATKLGHKEAVVKEQKLLDVALVLSASDMISRGIIDLNAAHSPSSTDGDVQIARFQFENASASEANERAAVLFRSALDQSKTIHDEVMREKTERHALVNLGCTKMTATPVQMRAAVADFRAAAILGVKWRDKQVHAVSGRSQRSRPCCAQRMR